METDFLKLDFREMFLNKHGKDIYNEIENIIINESKIDYDKEYISIIFKIALLAFWGLDTDGIQKLINDYYPLQKIDIVELMKKHKISISEISKYLKFTLDTEK